MSNDGTGLRERLLDLADRIGQAGINGFGNELRDIALSAVAPPPVLEGTPVAWMQVEDGMPVAVSFTRSETTGCTTPLFASPAAQPEGGDALPDALMPVADEWYRLCERRFSVERMTISGQLAEAIVAAVCTRPAPAQQAVTVDDAMAKRFIEAMRDSDGFLNSLSPAYVKDALTIALTSTAAKAAEGAK